MNSSADGQVETCSQCHGTGQVRTVQNIMGMQMQSTTTCPRCSGRGKIVKNPCQTCRGKSKVYRTHKVRVNVPAGINEGQTVRLRGEGCVGLNGGPNGDLMVDVYIKPHPIFRRDGVDVYCEVPITFTQAALGAEIEVPTLDGKIKFDLPEGTQTGKMFTMVGRGISYVNNPKRRGDHRFVAVVETPTKLNKAQKELLRQLDESLEGKSSPKRSKFFETIKDFFD